MAANRLPGAIPSPGAITKPKGDDSINFSESGDSGKQLIPAMKNLSPMSKLFIAMVVVSGAAVIAWAGTHDKPANLTEFVFLLIVSVVASRLRLKLPGVTGIMSMNLPFILIAIAHIGTTEALGVGCVSTFVQCLPRAGKKFNWVQIVFNVANMALTVEAARSIYVSALLNSAIHSHPLVLSIACAGFLAVNSIPISIVIALTENRNVLQAWTAMFQLSYPFFLASAGVAGVALTVSARFGWQIPLFVLPLMLLVFYSYRRYFSVSSASAADAKKASQSVGVSRAVS